MKVILLQNIKGFGQIGDVKNVSDGHARNFLFPRKLAAAASESALKAAEALQKKRETMINDNQENMQKAAAVLADAEITFKKKASPAGTLFSSLTKEEISKEFSKHAGVSVTPDMLDLGDSGEHIKHIGDYTATINLTTNIKTEIKITVKAG